MFDFVTFKTRDITNSRNNATSFKHTVFYFFHCVGFILKILDFAEMNFKIFAHVSEMELEI